MKKSAERSGIYPCLLILLRKLREITLSQANLELSFLVKIFVSLYLSIKLENIGQQTVLFSKRILTVFGKQKLLRNVLLWQCDKHTKLNWKTNFL